MRATLVLILAAACSEQDVLVHVEANADTTAVELFLVSTTCSDCAPGIGPPNTNAAIPGPVYYTDGDARVLAKLAPGQTSVDLHLRPGTGDKLLRIVAVGFDGQGNATSLALGPSDVTVSQHLGERWNLVLAPRTIMLSPATPIDIDAADGLLLWRPPADPANPVPADDRASCLMITHAATQQHEFIVPPIDADCDGITDKECKRTIYDYAATPDPTQLCRTTVASGQCRVGAISSCVDILGGEGCAPSRYCVPDVACTLASCEKPLDPNCLSDLLTTANSLIPRLECTVPIAAGVLCDPGATVDASLLFPKCTGVGFLLPQTMLPLVLQPSISVNGSATTQAMLGAIHAPCVFDVTFTGTPQTGLFHPGAIVVTGFAGDHVVVPFLANFTEAVGGCTGQGTTCGFAPMPSTDHVWSCGK